MTNYERELSEYQPKALNKIKYWMELYDANGSIIRQLYKNIFEYLLEDKATSLIITVEEFWLMKEREILTYLDTPSPDKAGRAGILHAKKVQRILLPQIAEKDPILSKYMKVIENTDERVEIHFIYPDE